MMLLGVLVAVVVLLLVLYALGLPPFTRATVICPTLEQRVVLPSSQGWKAFSGPGLANAAVYSFAVNPDSDRACASAVLNPYVSGSVAFSHCSSAGSCTGNVSFWTPAEWTKAQEGGLGTPTPLWCYNASYSGQATGPPCLPASNDTFSTQSVDNAIFTGNTTLDLVLWSGYGGEFSGDVAFWWEQ